MSRWWLVLPGVVLAVAAVACPSRLLRLRPDAPAQSVVRAPGQYGVTYRTEQEWIVWTILVRIASVAASANSQAAVPPVVVSTRSAPEDELFNRATLDATIGGKRLPAIVLDEHVWSPAAYVEIAKALLPRKAPARLEGGGEHRLFERLTEPRIGVILDEEATISSALRANRLDGRAHEEAALLFGTLALRECAGWFTDTRLLVSLATAHLAVSRALAGTAPLGPNGQVAGAIVSALAGREDLALPAIDRLPVASGAAAIGAWRAALRLRTIGDWRETDVPSTRTLLERLEYARAVMTRGGSARKGSVLDELEAEPIADRHRVILNGEGRLFTIEAGNRLVDEALEIEFEEMADVWRRYHRGAPTRDVLIRSLDEGAGASDRLIEWETWAGFLERHLCATLAATALHFNALGLDRDRTEWRQIAQPAEGLLLYPFVLVQAARNEEDFRAAVTGAVRLPSTRPDLFTARLADLVRTKPSFVDKPLEFSQNEFAWFTPFVPTGTTFELEERSESPNCTRPASVDQVARWAAEAPHNAWAAWQLAWRSVPEDPTFADTRKALAPVLEYDLRASLWMFRYLRATSEEYLWAARRQCQIDVDECARLGGELLFLGRDADAAAAFEHYVQNARDQVAVASQVAWLVRYDWDTGRRDAATRMAEEAGSVGSAAGLNIYGEVLERLGRDEEARAVFERVSERYETGGFGLATYCLRKAATTGDRNWVDRASKAVPKVFPHGIESLDLRALPSPPSDGIAFQSFGPRARRTGLLPDDIIVGVEGYRVRTVDQYTLIARSGFDPHMRLAVWHQGRYREVTVVMPQRYMGVTLTNHPSQAKHQRIEP